MYQCEQIGNKLLAPQVEEELLKYIVENPVAVGEKIPNEYELARLFGVGRSTVREAVKGLVSAGVLEVRRGSGTYVISTKRQAEDPLGLSKAEDQYRQTLDLLEVRLMLEPEIAAKAAARATAEDKRRIRQLCDEVEELYVRGVNHLEKDVAFHEYIAKTSGNRVVENLIPLIASAVIAFGELTDRALMRETIETHRAISDAIADNDPAGARYAMIMHLNYNRQKILGLLKDREKV